MLSNFNLLNTQSTTICLNMIVKNEENNIKTCLENIVSYINIDYWVICDTGSTDNTMNIISEFFATRDISGKLIQDEWINFAHNRTVALEHAYNKTDYVLLFDADDKFEGTLSLPTRLTCDKYLMKFGDNVFFYRPCLISNKIKWEYIGILHEYLSSKDITMAITSGVIDGEYFINFGTHGCRSKNPNKYLDDALLLDDAYHDNSNTNIPTSIKNRYAFYSANSYNDAGIYADAVRMYKIVINNNNWNQEKFYSCLKLGNLYMANNQPEHAIECWFSSFIYDNERIETIIALMNYFFNKGNHFIVNSLFAKFALVATQTNNFTNIDFSSKLFCTYSDIYRIHYYNSISAYYEKDYSSGYKSCLYLIKQNKFVTLTKNNLKFYVDRF